MLRSFLIIVAALVSVGAAPAQDANRPSIFPQLGHNYPIVAVAFSPDGKLLASASADKTIKLWDVGSGRELRTLTGDTAAAAALAFSPDGTLLASGGVDATLRIWTVASGRLRRVSQAQSSAITSLAFSPDGTELASGSADNTLKLWDVAAGQLKGSVSGAGGALSVAYSPDGKLLAAGGADHVITLWDLQTAKSLFRLSGHTDSVDAVSFSPDGKTLASGGSDKTIKLWDVASGRELRSLRGSEYPVQALVFSPDGSLLASADHADDFTSSGDSDIRLWQVASGRPLAPLVGHAAAVMALTLSPDGRTLASGGWDNTIRLWDATGQRPPRILHGNAGGIEAIAVSPDGKILASASLDKTIKLWDAASGRNLGVLAGHDGFVESVAFSPDGTLLASASDDRTVRIWELPSGRALRTLSGHADVVNQVVFSPDGKALASASDDKTIKLWDVASGGLLRTLTGHAQGVQSLAYSPNGRLLASGGQDHAVKLWDLMIGGVRTLNGHDDGVASVTFSPDGAMLASGGFDKTVRLWSVESGQPLRVIDAQAGHINSVAFSPDGKLLAAGGADRTIQLWDLADNRVLRTLNGHTNSVNSVAFTHQGQVLVSGGSDGSTRVWDVSSGKERASLIAFKDGSSIAVTPEGFFDSSSAQAEENLNVRIGQRVYGISSFRENFNRPDLVRRALAGESLADFGDIADVKLSPQIELADLPATTADATLKLTVKLSDGGGGVGAVRVFEKGTVILQDDAAGAATRSYTVPLSSGMNDLRVAAANTTGDMWSEAEGHVAASLSANDNAAATPAKGTLHAIVIGIDRFPKFASADKIDLTYAGSDAKLFSDALTQYAASLFAKLDVTLLTGPNQTDRASIIKALKAMQASVGPNDAFVFYVASHGIVRGGEYYVVTSDTGAFDADALKRDALSRRELTDLLANIATTNKVVFIDTCQAGALGDSGQPVFSTRGMDPKTAAKIISNQIGLNMLMASSTSQEAFEGYQNHGLFTWVLTQGLSGKAADPTSGLVSSQGLASYVDTQVPLLAQTTYHQDQQPLDNQPGPPFMIAKVR